MKKYNIFYKLILLNEFYYFFLKNSFELVNYISLVSV